MKLLLAAVLAVFSIPAHAGGAGILFGGGSGAGGGGGGAPSGAAGGDLNGTYPNPTVGSLSNTIPSAAITNLTASTITVAHVGGGAGGIVVSSGNIQIVGTGPLLPFQIGVASFTVDSSGNMIALGSGTVAALNVKNVQSGNQCLHADGFGNVTGTGSDCGSGGGLSGGNTTSYPKWTSSSALGNSFASEVSSGVTVSSAVLINGNTVITSPLSGNPGQIALTVNNNTSTSGVGIKVLTTQNAPSTIQFGNGNGTSYLGLENSSGGGGAGLITGDLPNASILNSVGPIQFAPAGVIKASILANGHFVSSGTTPSIACGAGTPVTGVGSSDQAGNFSAGTAATACTITFASAWGQINGCFGLTSAAVPVALSVTSISNSAVTFTAASALTGDQIYYLCWGNK